MHQTDQHRSGAIRIGDNADPVCVNRQPSFISAGGIAASDRIAVYPGAALKN